MELYEEKVNQKKSKLPTIILACIAMLLIITIALIIGIIYLKNTITTIKIDGIEYDEIQDIFYRYSTETESKLYVPILKISQYLGYEGYTGDYFNKSEDKSKCHIINENEAVMFTVNSNIIVKILNDSEIEYVTLEEPVFERNGELYTTIEGLEKSFNVMVSNDIEFKNIEIFSMDYLMTHYASKLNIEQYSLNFSDKKAIFENMIIIQSDGKYGIIHATTGELILETKYEEIRYLPSTTDFIVKSNGKYGIVTKDAIIKVKTIYDEIKSMDNLNGLYLVKQNNAYGVINIEGKVIIAPEYKQIGIDISKYTQNGVENSYILLDEIIPIKNNQDLWGFFNIQGEQITEFKYTGIGCIESTVNNSYPVLVIPNYKIIVAQKDKYYTLITSEGKQLIQDNVLNSVYLKLDTETDQNQYFMIYNNNEKVINIEEWLER